MRVLRPVSPIPTELPDFARFVTGVAERISSRAWAQDSAADDTPVFAARAPGRLDVMGGIADYSGSLVLQWPIRESTRVAVQRRADRVLHIESSDVSGTHI